jgi:glycosyltransferase involved in cell wall biosynthesis
MVVLVGDDASDDGTSEVIEAIARAHPDLVRHVRHPIRMGGAENWKATLRLARGEYIAWCDGDDYWLPGKLSRQIAFLDANPDCAAVYTNAIAINESGEPIGRFNNVGDARFDLAAMIRRGNFLNTSSILFRAGLERSVLEIEGPFIDFRAHLRYARSGNLAHIGQPLVAYRVAARGSVLVSDNAAIRRLYWEAILDVPRDQISDDDFAHGIADFLRRVITRSLTARRLSLLREWVPRVFATSPYGRMRTGALTLASACRALASIAFGTLWLRVRGDRSVVLYRR